MTAQDFTDILFFYEEFKPQYIKYVDSIREIEKNVQAIDKFKTIEDRYKDDVFDKIYDTKISDVCKKAQEIKDAYCSGDKGCKAHCKNCCVIECINKGILEEIEKANVYKNSYQTLLNTINITIKHICEVHKNADDRTQKHLKVCLEILHLFRYEMLCLQQLLEIYRPQPKNNSVLSNQTFPKTPDFKSIKLEESPEYGSVDEFWEELSAIQQKKLEEEYQHRLIDEQVEKGKNVSYQVTFDFSDQWKKYPEQMKKWAETPKTVPELIKKHALEFQDKKPQILSENNIVKQSEHKNLKVFISYSYDDEQHKQWVELLAKKLKENNIDIILDKWHTKLGQPLTNFMEQSVLNAQRVICILTPTYKKKADNLRDGVGYEYSIVTSEILKQVGTTKFIPVLRSGNRDDAIPISLNGRKYLDMKNDADFDEKVCDLLNDLIS